MPRDANPSGATFGGWTLSQMDLAGATPAAQRARARVAAVSINEMRFLRPIEVGDEVGCRCTLEEVGGTSAAARIEVWTCNRDGSGAEKVTEGVSTYVALGEDGKQQDVPEDAKEG